MSDEAIKKLVRSRLWCKLKTIGMVICGICAIVGQFSVTNFIGVIFCEMIGVEYNGQASGLAGIILLLAVFLSGIDKYYGEKQE